MASKQKKSSKESPQARHRRMSSMGMPPDQIRLDLGDFDMEDMIGEGSFSQVFIGRLKDRIPQSNKLRKKGDQFACKVIIRRSIQINRQAKQLIAAVLREKRALYECKDIPFVLHIYATAKNDSQICFVTELCRNGDLHGLLKKYGPFAKNALRYHIAAMIVALYAMHTKGIIHRDIKPENIMLNDSYQPRLSDFGCVKLIPRTEEEREPKSTDPDFVGTPEFMAPELATSHESGGVKDNDYKCLDYWSLGCLLYQLHTGNLLFTAGSEYLVIQKVLRWDHKILGKLDDDVSDLCSKLLARKPTQRIGVKKIKDLKSHRFFDGFDWDNLTTMDAPPINEKFEKAMNDANNNANNSVTESKAEE